MFALVFFIHVHCPKYQNLGLANQQLTLYSLLARKDPYKRQAKKTSVSRNKLFFILTRDQVRIKVHEQLFLLLGVNYLHKPNELLDILNIFDMTKRETYIVKYLYYRNVSDVAEGPLISFLRLISQNVSIDYQNLPPYLEI